jgi:hypothetical protein
VALRNIHKFELSDVGPLYGVDAAPVRAELRRALREANSARVTALVIYQSAHYEYTVPFLDWLRSIGLVKDLEESLLEYRALLEEIRFSEVPCVFVANKSAYGSVYELMQACPYRAATNPRESGGFPEVEGGAFPLGGDFGTSEKKSGVAESPMRPFVDWCDIVSKDFSDDMIASLVSHFLPTRRPPKPPATRGRLAVERVINELNKQIEANHLESFSGVDLYRWLLKKRLFSGSDLETGLAHIGAKALLSSRFANWFEGQLQTTSQAIGQVRPEKIFVSLNLLAPPVAVLTRLLEAETSVCFVCSDPVRLADLVSVLSGRLQRLASSSQIQTLWDTHVGWVTAFDDSKFDPMVSFTLDDQMVIRHNGRETAFVRLEGNHFDALSGMAEQLSKDLDPEVARISALLFESSLHPGENLEWPASFHARHLFFESLVSAAVDMNLEFEELLNGLKEYDWGYSAVEVLWDRFLRTRFDSFHPKNIETFGGGITADYEFSSIKQVRAFLQSRIHKKSATKFNKAKLSRHLCICSIWILACLVRRFGQSAVGALDTIVGRSLGMPRVAGTPLQYLREFGRGRFYEYSATHWKSQIKLHLADSL